MRPSAAVTVATLGLALASLAAAEGLGEQMDGYLAELHAAGELVGSVSVTRGDEVLLAKGYGYADAEHRAPNTPQTRFRIGSITKQFTAVAVLMLQERGKLKVTDALETHLDDIPESWRGLTIHQLLTHTSGIMHSWALPGFRETMMVPSSLDAVVARYHDEPLLFPPGEGYQYSGVGYFLLAEVIESASGERYGDFLQAEIFAPLEMQATGPDRPEIVLEHRARGYVIEDGVLRNAPDLYMPILTGGGNLYSTAEDLVRWDRALTRGELLSEASFEALYRPERESYAYGSRIDELEGRRAVRHGGGVPGFTSHILRIPDEGLCVVILTNVQPGKVPETAERLARMALARD